MDQSPLLESMVVHAVHAVHESQLLTCLTISGLGIGLMMNFNETQFVDGIRRRLL